MLNYNEIKSGKVLVLDNEPMEVLWTSGIVKKQRQKPHLSAKLRNIKSGAVVERTFTQADKVTEAELETKEMKFVYASRGKAVFTPPNNPANRNEVDEGLLGNDLNYIIEGSVVEMLIFDNEIIGIKLPIKVELTVAEAPPNIRGNTSAGGNKVVILETGLKVTTPLFVEQGDRIIVNTETGEYSARA